MIGPHGASEIVALVAGHQRYELRLVAALVAAFGSRVVGPTHFGAAVAAGAGFARVFVTEWLVGSESIAGPWAAAAVSMVLGAKMRSQRMGH